VPARQIDNLVYFPDFMPTLAALTGSEQGLPQQTDGMDISPLFFGRDIDTDSRDLYWEFPGKQRAVRHGPWKAVSVKKGAPLELYRIKEDPLEQKNLADDYPDVVRELDALMWRLRTPSPNYPIEGE
jgi:arylsulfatase A-like enzyme